MENTEKNYLIYSYEIEEAVYVGLTKNLKKRDKAHRMPSNADTLFRFCQNKNINIPDPIVLENSLTAIEAQAKEAD